jgi:hypothetical protein
MRLALSAQLQGGYHRQCHTSPFKSNNPLSRAAKPFRRKTIQHRRNITRALAYPGGLADAFQSESATSLLAPAVLGGAIASLLGLKAFAYAQMELIRTGMLTLHVKRGGAKVLQLVSRFLLPPHHHHQVANNNNY